MTPMQRRAFVIINDSINTTGIPPTFDQIAKGLGVKYKSGVARVVDALQEQGYIRKTPNRARAIQIIKMPPGVVDPVQEERNRCAKIVSMFVVECCTIEEVARAINDGTSFDSFERSHKSGSARPPGLV